MLKQPLAGGTKQQAGESTATARADYHDVMVITRLGERFDRIAWHNLLVDFKVGMSLLNRLDAHGKVIHVRIHDTLVFCGALDIWYSGDYIELSLPA